MTIGGNPETPRPARRRKLGVLAVLTVVPVIVAATLMRLFGSYLLPAPSPVIQADPAGIVELGGGITIQAESGTVRRDIVDWLNSHRSGARLFAVGDHQFVGDTAELTAESRGRLRGLAMFLRAETDVTATVVGYSAPAGDPRMPEQRARGVVRELAADGIAADRLGVEIRDSGASSDQRDRPIAILLARPESQGDR